MFIRIFSLITVCKFCALGNYLKTGLITLIIGIQSIPKPVKENINRLSTTVARYPPKRVPIGIAITLILYKIEFTLPNNLEGIIDCVTLANNTLVCINGNPSEPKKIDEKIGEDIHPESD